MAPRIGEKHHLSITWADKKRDEEGGKIIARAGRRKRYGWGEGDWGGKSGAVNFPRIALTLRGRLVADFRFSRPELCCTRINVDSGNSCITRNRHRGRQP